MKLKCVILDDYQNAALSMADWSVLQDRVEVRTLSRYFSDQNQLVDEIKDSEIVIIMRERTPFTAELLAKLPKLKLLITSGMRNASIDLKAATAQGVTVCGTASGSEAPMELTWALLLGLARHIVPENNALRANGPWQSSVGVTLHGKRLGLLGLGKIGRKVARVAQAFGMEVTAWSQNLTQETADEVGVTLASSKQALLESSDFVSIHLVLGDRSRGLIGAAEFEQMKPSAYLINTSRAAIIDRSALIDALVHGRIAGAGLDVFDVEPLPENDIFRTLPNVLATPHLGYVADKNYQGYFREAVEDIEAFISGSPVRRLG
ncbi:D-2-hydroxyacid dehydrogenase family protein [Budvicia aquatica]|uniref:D-2-hydroxyacid dehydrogenase family protein n=1 Tax=Budvicia aquatica TaxID=82979 RepID=UPI001B55F074|nr:D-2-hydroxyacid dehydrogenase family protein [Budvicia aquatica]MBP9642754.1 D-2-hydroxyacid dehydrogenase family protein [Budvicia sp.]GKX53666.1 2-hydroxyacid dehydrogenase [Budvicia aquatica]